MTGPALDRFCVILANLSPGNAPKWNYGVMQIYQIGLRDVPNEAASPLTEAIIDACTFRPSVAEIKAMYRDLTQGDRPSAPALVGEVMGLLAEYGAYGQRDTKYGAHNFYLLGEPEGLSPAARAVVAVWGGWVKFAEDPSPGGVRRGQMLKIAQQVIDGTTSDTMHRLRLEVEAAAAALPAPAINIGQREDADPPAFGHAGRIEASAVMARIGRLLPAPEREEATV